MSMFSTVLRKIISDQMAGGGSGGGAWPSGIKFIEAPCAVGRFSGEFTRSDQVTTVDGVEYPIYQGAYTVYEGSGSTVFDSRDPYYVYAVKYLDTYSGSYKYWWALGGRPVGYEEFGDGYMGDGKGSVDGVPELTADGWTYNMAGTLFDIPANTVEIIA